MKKNKNNVTEPVVQEQPVAQEKPVLDVSNPYPVRERTLQAYYTDAYMKERERLNCMFGLVEGNHPFEYAPYTAQQESTQAPTEAPEQKNDAPAACCDKTACLEKKLKKTKGALAAFIVISIVAVAAAVVFAVQYFL